MSSSRGPSLRELAVQALSSVEGGYDRLAPKFDRSPFRTPDRVLDATEVALRSLGPFGRGLDDDLAASGFTVTTVPLTALGRRRDGSPQYRLVLALR